MNQLLAGAGVTIQEMRAINSHYPSKAPPGATATKIAAPLFA